MSTEITKYSYNEFQISFSGEEQRMVNATEMAKVFGKRPNDWLSLPSSKDFISTLSNVRKSGISNLIVTKQGSPENGGGTWFNEDVAIEFARWLSPIFAIWCNDRIKEIINQELKEENKRLQNQASFPICKQSISMQTMANFLTTYTGEKIGRTTLFAICRKWKYIQQESTRPYQRYINNGFFEVTETKGKIVPLITPKGQVVIAKRVKKSLPNKIQSFCLF